MAISLPYVLKGGTVGKSNFFDPAVDIMKALANQKKQRFESLAITGFTTASYADLPGASVAFTKILGAAQSDVEIEISAQAYNSAGPPSYTFFLGARVAGADWNVCRYFFNVSVDHRSFSGSVRIPNLPAGALTAQLRGRNSTAGPTTIVNSDDLVVVTVKEIPIVQ